MNMTFSQALEKLKEGSCAQRSGWNGKGMYLFIVKGEAVTDAVFERYGNPNNSAEKLPVNDAIYMRTADSKLVPWLASQTDLLAEDWSVIEVQAANQV